MRKLFLLAFVIGSVAPLKASLQQGKTFGQEMLGRSGNVATTLNPAQAVPQYTATPKEAKLDEESLNKSVLENVQTHPSYKLVKESEKKRGKFLNLHEDPLVTFSRDLAQDPLALLSKFYKDCREVPLEGSAAPPPTEQKTCEEAGEPYTLTCMRDLVVTLPVKTKKYAYTHIFGKQFRREGRNYGKIVPQTRAPHRYKHDQVYDYKQTTFIPDTHIRYWDGCQYYPHTVKNYYTYQKKIGTRPPVTITEAEYLSKEVPIEDVLEEWVSRCTLLEEKVDSGLCHYVSKTCSQGAQTRLINGTSVTRPCWQETFTYHCTVPAKNDCAGLRHQGCHQVSSRCAQSIGSTCVLYTQTFSCIKPSNPQGKGVKTRIVCGEAPHCLAGDCVEQGYPLNGEMLQVMSQMSVLKELQNQMKDGLLEIFKGQDNRCSRDCVDFKDCCGGEGGWGVSAHLTSCSADEQALVKKRQKNQCHRIGTYCSKKALGVCVEKSTTFCCFGSSFLRTIQEQARRQIGLGWGNAETPLCRGLTIEELSRVDFSKLDLREIFQELSAKYKQPQSAVMGQKIQTRMQEIQDSLQKNPRARQRGEG